MNKGMKYFTEGMLAAFVLAPRVPVKAIEPAPLSKTHSVGNPAQYWNAAGQRMSVATLRIGSELKSNRTLTTG